MRLVLVPIREQQPPSMLAKLSGMRNLDFGIPIRVDHASTMGIIMATTGVLFMNAEITATGKSKRICATNKDVGAPRTDRRSTSTTPTSCRPCATMNSTATAITPGVENPDHASVWLIIRSSRRHTVADSMTTSGGLLLTMNNRATTVMPAVAYDSQDNCGASHVYRNIRPSAAETFTAKSLAVPPPEHASALAAHPLTVDRSADCSVRSGGAGVYNSAITRIAPSKTVAATRHDVLALSIVRSRWWLGFGWRMLARALALGDSNPSGRTMLSE